MTVTCVLLTADRPAMTARAIRCFLAQTYEAKQLLILDNGKVPIQQAADQRVTYSKIEHGKLTFGELRNFANRMASTDLIAHWDSDDWSHPRRLEHQIGMLEESGEVVGYRDLMFWDTTRATEELWLYTGGSTFATDTSRLYRRSMWERNPYPVGGLGVDNAWLYNVPTDKRCIVSSVNSPQPMMIAQIHGANMQREHKWMNTPQGKRQTSPYLIEWVREQMNVVAA